MEQDSAIARSSKAARAIRFRPVFVAWLTVCIDAYLIAYIWQALRAQARGDGEVIIYLVPMTVWAVIVTTSGILLTILTARRASMANTAALAFAVVAAGPVLLLTVPRTLGYPLLFTYFFVLLGSVVATVAIFAVERDS